MHKGLKFISLFKIIRGVGALLVSFSLLWASQTGAENIGELVDAQQDLDLLKKLVSLSPEWFGAISSHQILLLAIFIFALSITRFIEGMGIWFNRSWAEWLAIGTGLLTALTLLYGLSQGFHVRTLILLIVNISILIYLLWILSKKNSLK